MRLRGTLFGFTILLLGLAHAQETNNQGPTLASTATAEQTYFVQLIEFRLKSPLDPKLGLNEIAVMFDQLSRDGKIEVIENIRLSTLERHESVVHFGIRTPVVASSSGNAQTRSRSFQIQNIGTTVRVNASPHLGKVLVAFDYEKGYLKSSEMDDLPPDIIQSSFKTTQLLDIGKPKIVAGTSSEASDFLIITISK